MKNPILAIYTAAHGIKECRRGRSGLNSASLTFLAALEVCDTDGAMNMTAFAKRMRFSSAAGTGLADRMVETGDIARGEGPDRRQVTISITEAGKAKLATIRAARGEGGV